MKQLIQEIVPMRGEFRLWVYRRGILIEEYEDNNLIVNGALTAMAYLVSGGGTEKLINRIAFGTNGNAPSTSDTTITSAYNKAVSSFTYPAAGQVEINWNLLVGEANGKAIMEFGLLCTDGTLFARKNRVKAIEKDSDISLEGKWLLIF
jgi:hypothetical protein